MPTFSKGICRAPCATWATSRTAWDREIHFKDAEMRLVGNDDAVDTFERFSEHLKTNGVDLEKTEIGFGKELQIDPQDRDVRQ